MSMSKKDHEAIARAIEATESNMHITIEAWEAPRKIAERIADYCAAQSQSFDRARFLKACGVSE